MVCVLLHDGDYMWITENEAFSGQPIIATAVMYRNHPLSDWQFDEESIDILDSKYTK